MHRSTRPVVGLLFLLCSFAVRSDPEDLESILKFEADAADEFPLPGWSGGPAHTIRLDGDIVHSGKGAARLERDADSLEGFSTITRRIPMDFDGNWIDLRGFLRSTDVAGFAGLWMRQDAYGDVLEFDNMGNRGVNGTTEWTEYSVRLPVNQLAGSWCLAYCSSAKARSGPTTCGYWSTALHLLMYPDARSSRRFSTRTGSSMTVPV